MSPPVARGRVSGSMASPAVNTRSPMCASSAKLGAVLTTSSSATAVTSLDQSLRSPPRAAPTA